MLAGRRGDGLEKPEQDEERMWPTFEDFCDDKFRRTTYNLFEAETSSRSREEQEDYKTRLERLVRFPTKRERAWASLLDLVSYDSFSDPDFRETMETLLERGPEEQEDYKARLKRLVRFPTERERAWAFVLDLMSYEARLPIKQVLRLDGFMSTKSKDYLEGLMQFELVGVHHAAQPDTVDSRMYASLLEKLLKFVKEKVGLDVEMSHEAYRAASARCDAAAREHNEEWQIAEACGVRVSYVGFKETLDLKRRMVEHNRKLGNSGWGLEPSPTAPHTPTGPSLGDASASSVEFNPLAIIVIPAGGAIGALGCCYALAWLC